MAIRIINSRGIPGTLACLGHTVHQRRPVFLTSCHVLFAAGAGRHDEVWQVVECSGRRRYRRLGRALHGTRGVVRYRGDDYFVDCAIGSLEVSLDLPEGAISRAPVSSTRDEQVWKSGAASQTTRGIVVDASYCCSAQMGTARHARMRDMAPRQLLIRSSDQQRPFVEEGDSGALIRNEDNAPIGLLWGSTIAAEGVASPIAPVLHALNIELCETHV